MMGAEIYDLWQKVYDLRQLRDKGLLSSSQASALQDVEIDYQLLEVDAEKVERKRQELDKQVNLIARRHTDMMNKRRASWGQPVAGAEACAKVVKQIIDKQLQDDDKGWVSRYYVEHELRDRISPIEVFNNCPEEQRTNNGIRNLENGAKAIFAKAMTWLCDEYELYDTRIMPIRPKAKFAELAQGVTNE